MSNKNLVFEVPLSFTNVEFLKISAESSEGLIQPDQWYYVCLLVDIVNFFGEIFVNGESISVTPIPKGNPG